MPMDLSTLPVAASTYRLLCPIGTAGPIVFTSPHSGQQYSAEFKAAARLDPHTLRRSEDSFVDELFGDAPLFGAPLLAATFPRAWCDANREAWELDPAMFDAPLPSWINTSSPRVAVGLGTIAKIVATGEAIYRRKLSFSEAESRIRTCWFPFHDQLSQLIASARALHGYCLLVDCHSMPSTPNIEGTDVIVGDAFGTAAAPPLTRRVEETLRGFGYRVRRNDPYAGGFITRHYGRPREGVHALQIEISRNLYMNEAKITKRSSFPTVRGHISAFIQTLTRENLDFLAPEAVNIASG